MTDPLTHSPLDGGPLDGSPLDGEYRLVSPMAAERPRDAAPAPSAPAGPAPTPSGRPGPAEAVRPDWVFTPAPPATWTSAPAPATQSGPIVPPTAGPPTPPAPPFTAPPPGSGGTGGGGRHRHRRGRRALTVAAAALLIGGVGGGVLAAALGGGSGTGGVNVASSADLTSDQSNAVATIADQVEPAVVTIKSIVTDVTEGTTSDEGYTSTTTGGSTGGYATGGSTGGGYGEEEELEGTGMIVTSSGEVVTNNHVIAGASTISVTLHGSSKSYRAKVLGTDPTDDIALLQIEGVSGLPTVTFGNSAQLAVGDSVVAIGNALGLGGSPTVTSGIISAEDREITAGDDSGSGTETLTDMLQTDAAINPGNSGGPLIDSAGQVIGMDTAAAGTDSDGSSAEDIGFAIPSNRIVAVIAKLAAGAK